MPSRAATRLRWRRSQCRCDGPCASAPKSECRRARPRRPQATVPSSRPARGSGRSSRDRVLVLAARRPVAPVQHDVRRWNAPGHVRADGELCGEARFERHAEPANVREGALAIVADDLGLENVLDSDEPRDEGLDGRVSTACAVSVCSVLPWCRIDIRSASIDASCNACVTRITGMLRPARKSGQLLVELLPRHLVDRGERLVEQQTWARASAARPPPAAAGRRTIARGAAPRGRRGSSRSRRPRARSRRSVAARAPSPGSRCRSRRDAETAHSSGTRISPSARAPRALCPRRCRATLRRATSMRPRAGV